jgi:hypothetical protein
LEEKYNGYFSPLGRKIQRLFFTSWKKNTTAIFHLVFSKLFTKRTSKEKEGVVGETTFPYKIELLFSEYFIFTQNNNNNNNKMNQLLNELGIRKDSIASSMIDKIKQKETIELLQSYDISILKELNKTLFNQEANDLYQLYQIVHKRNGQSGFIDLNSDQDDTANLSCGTAIYNVMDKIDEIIVKKMNVIK